MGDLGIVRPPPEHRGQRGLVQGGQLQHAQTLELGLPSQLVGPQQRGLSAVGEVVPKSQGILLGQAGGRRLHDLSAANCHFLAVTLVPLPSSEAMSNSSIRRLTPGRPNPRPVAMEHPSSSALSRSAMPGPSSLASMTTPRRSSVRSSVIAMCPRVAYSRMLRASSEIAVAIMV